MFMARRFVHVLLTTAIAVPLPAFAVYHLSPVSPRSGVAGRSDTAHGRQQELSVIPYPTPIGSVETSPLPTPEVRKGKLREERHAQRFERVQGLVNGMTNKLGNLSERLDTHLRNFERRIAALEASGRDLTVDSELAAARAAVAKMQLSIADILAKLSALPDSETPRQHAQTVRSLVRDLRGQLRELRASFQALREAIRDDVRASRPSPSPLSSPSPTFAPTPTLIP